MYTLDPEEQEILAAYEAGKLRRVQNPATTLAAHHAAARATLARRADGNRIAEPSPTYAPGKPD